MNKKIRVSVTHEMHASTKTKEERQEIIDLVNAMLKPMADEIIQNNAEVDVKETSQGLLRFIAIADNIELENRMQAMLNSALKGD